MIMRGGGAIGAAGFTGAAACICVTLLCTGGCAAGGALPACGAGGVTRGTPIADGTVLALIEAEPAAGVVALGGEILGGVTTTDGGR